MPDLHLNTLNFDRGIDSVSYQPRESQAWPKPERHDLPPSGDAVRTQMGQLLGKPDLANYLNEQLRPRDFSPELLMPGHFSRALDEAQTHLREAAADLPETESRALTRAARLLGDDIKLRALLNQYRQALLQG